MNYIVGEVWTHTETGKVSLTGETFHNTAQQAVLAYTSRLMSSRMAQLIICKVLPVKVSIVDENQHGSTDYDLIKHNEQGEF